MQASLLAVIGNASFEEKDDLKKIVGVGVKLEKLLNNLGIYTFEQVSKLTDTQYALIDSLLSAFQGRAKRDEWAEQAKELLTKKLF